MTKFYIIISPDTDDTCVHCDDQGVASVFETEAEALSVAKDYVPSVVVKATIGIIETRRTKVTKYK